MIRKAVTLLAVPAALVGLSLAAPRSDGAAAPAAPGGARARPKVEVVFCLDTTGSMTGLIDGAKAKIWAICNQIAGGKPTPDLKVGLVAYRDRGDAYITQVHDLTDDLDHVHSKLKTFVAAGGGDTPESVNQALYDSVHKIKWSKDSKTLRIIFLVGDAPPHMDYPDDVKYPVTCAEACKRGIIINTVQCGNDAECTKYWKDIAKKAEGSYVAIPQNGGVTVVHTPFDGRLGELNRELATSTIVYGRAEEQRRNLSLAKGAAGLPTYEAAARIGYQAMNAQVATFDLIDGINRGRVKLDKLKKEELPPAMRKMTLPQQKAYLAKIEQKRRDLNREVLDLNGKRNSFIAKKQAEDAKKGKTSFDRQVIQMLQNQARKYAIAY